MYSLKNEWPLRWYPVTQEDAGFNLLVAIPMKMVTFGIRLAHPDPHSGLY